MKKSKKPATKKSTAVSTKKAKSSATVRNSRLAKYATKIDRLGGGKVTMKSLSSMPASVIVTMPNQPVELFGTILESNEDFIVVRTQRKSGSSKPAIKTFLRSQIVSQIGSNGDNTLLTVLDTKELLNIRHATVALDGSTAHVTDTKTGDTISVNRHAPGVDVEIIYDEA